MQLVFESLTGNVRRLAGRVARQAGLPDALDLRHAVPQGDYLLLTYTFQRGTVPGATSAFLARHSAGLRGVVASGSYHWGDTFARAADLIAAHYHVPVVAKVNKAGSDADVARIVRWVQAHHRPSLSPDMLEAAWTPGSN
ncbi:class Ib ribonucleoside-diphosphate reductase assembly flavoprotein NrdI [Deinococcus sonorensis]|uniref:Class Ib ribonucleoside-diphosphate reductase assembly flavoprotein NrdI n=2 Tax=Deinococcus sonorensis TaxID=309891 RepID=A0AAU7UE73_9DEIO